MMGEQARLQHYDIKSLAKSMKLSSIDVIKTSSNDIESHWYRSSGPADLYFWKTKNKIVKHQISLFNQVVEWNEYDGVKTGFVSEESAEVLSETVLFDDQVNPSVVEQVVEFLLRVEQIEPEVRDQLVKNYQFYNRWGDSFPIRFLRHFYRRVFRKV